MTINIRQFKATLALCVCIALFSGLAASDASAQTTAFTYQGKLVDNGAPANGLYDFTVTLWNAVTNGSQIGSTSALLNTPVVDGIFTVTLDFGAGAFTGANRFLEIGVKLSGNPIINPTLLTPRQQVLSTPYAIKSLGSMSADSLSVSCVNCITSSQIASVSGGAVSGAIPVASVPAGSGNYIQNSLAQQASSNFNISGNGTAGGTLSANSVNSTTQYNLSGNRVLSNAGTNNLFAGVTSGIANTTGNNNAFFGASAGDSNTTGNGNAFFGSLAGQANLAGSLNSFFGSNAGQGNVSGANNSFFGTNAGFTSTGNSNSFFGSSAGRNNNGGFNNSFFGKEAGFNNSGANNAFFGVTAGFSNGSNDNSFFGASAGQSNTTGASNSFFGRNAGLVSATGNGNSFFGKGAGLNNDTGGNNAFVGLDAGANNTTGGFNAFLGTSAGISNDIGSNNTVIGADVAASNLSNATAIGYRAAVSQSNSLVLGSIAGVNGAASDTKVGIGTAAPSERLTVKTPTGRYGVIHTDGTITLGSFVGGAANGGYIGTKSNHPLHFFTNNGPAAVTLETTGFLRLNNVDAGGSLNLCLGPSNHISFCSSSLRYKTDMQSFAGGLDIVRRQNDYLTREQPTRGDSHAYMATERECGAGPNNKLHLSRQARGRWVARQRCLRFPV